MRLKLDKNANKQFAYKKTLITNIDHQKLKH